MEFSKTKLTSELAEFLGIMVGDGNIYINKLKNVYRFVITGHSENDYNYLTNYVINLIFKLFGKKPHIWKYNKKNAIGIALYSKEVINLLLSLGLIAGKKSQTVEIPEIILISHDRKIKAAFLRGLADTDFCVTFKRDRNNYPVITGTTSSENLAYQMKEVLKEFSIKACVYKRKPHGYSKVIQYQITCYCTRNFNFWMRNIGFRNLNHLSKVAIWQNFNIYPKPFSSLKERLLILNNNILLPRVRLPQNESSAEGRLVA